MQANRNLQALTECVRLTLKTSDGCTGVAVLGYDEAPMAWPRGEPEGETVAAIFDQFGTVPGVVVDSFEIEGDDWRRGEDTGEVDRIPQYVAAEFTLREAVSAAINGSEPSGYDEATEEARAELRGARAALADIEAIARHLQMVPGPVSSAVWVDVARIAAGDSPRFSVDGGPAVRLAEMLDANSSDEGVFWWAIGAEVGQEFPAHVTCRRVA